MVNSNDSNKKSIKNVLFARTSTRCFIIQEFFITKQFVELDSPFIMCYYVRLTDNSAAITFPKVLLVIVVTFYFKIQTHTGSLQSDLLMEQLRNYGRPHLAKS